MYGRGVWYIGQKAVQAHTARHALADVARVERVVAARHQVLVGGLGLAAGGQGVSQGNGEEPPLASPLAHVYLAGRTLWYKQYVTNVLKMCDTHIIFSEFVYYILSIENM